MTVDVPAPLVLYPSCGLPPCMYEAALLPCPLSRSSPNRTARAPPSSSSSLPGPARNSCPRPPCSPVSCLICTAPSHTLQPLPPRTSHVRTHRRQACRYMHAAAAHHSPHAALWPRLLACSPALDQSINVRHARALAAAGADPAARRSHCSARPSHPSLSHSASMYVHGAPPPTDIPPSTTHLQQLGDLTRI